MDRAVFPITNSIEFDFVISTIQTIVDVSDVENKTIRKGLKFERSLNTGFKNELSTVKILDYVYPRVIEMEYKTSKQTSRGSDIGI